MLQLQGRGGGEVGACSAAVGCCSSLGTREAGAEAGHVVTSAAGAEAVDVNMLRIRSAGVISLIVEIKQYEESFWLMCVVVAVAWRGVVLMSLVCASSLLHHPFRIIIN